MNFKKDASNELFNQNLITTKLKFYQEEHRRLTILFDITRNISTELKLDKLLLIMMDEVKRALMADRCTIFLLDKKKNELWSKVAHGEREIKFPSYLGIAGYVATTGDILNIPDAYADPRFNREIDKKTGYHTKNMLTFPMRNKLGEIIGVFQVLNKHDGVFTKEDEKLIDAISVISATHVENAQLYEEQKKTIDSFIETLASTIDARDPFMAGHSHRTALYADAIARVMNISQKRREILRYAALVHDYGKIAIREDVLKKKGILTKQEIEEMKDHPKVTREILKKINFNGNNISIPAIAAAHHEKMDGSGYPDGIKGNDIPLEARILAVADVFDAYTSDRHHRKKKEFKEVLQILDKDSGSHFDENCVTAFKQIKLDVLVNILIYNSSEMLDNKDLKFFSNYNINQLVDALNNKPLKGDKNLIATVFLKYYNKDTYK